MSTDTSTADAGKVEEAATSPQKRRIYVREEDATNNTPVIGTASGQVRREPVIVSETQAFRLDHFAVPNHYKPYVSSVLLPHGMLMDRVERLAADIRQDYGASTPHFLCVLKGAAEFFSDLSRALRRHHEYFPHSAAPYTFDFIRVKSYENDSSTGTVRIMGAELDSMRGRDVIIVEDIIDSGLTMTRLVPLIKEAGAASVKVASLLEKRTERSCGFKGDYIGFSVPDSFIVGYNMDYNEVYRDLRHLCVISEEGLKKFAQIPPMSPALGPKAAAVPGDFVLGEARASVAAAAAAPAPSS